MPVDVPQRFRQVMQRVFIPALLVAARRQSAVCTRNLIQISIFFEQIQSLPGKTHGQFLPRQVLAIDGTHHIGTPFHYQIEIFPLFQQFCHCLRCIRLEIDIPVFPADTQTFYQIVKLTQYHILRCIRFIHTARPFHIIIIEQLGSITFQRLVYFYFINRLQGLLFLLQIIVINGRSNGKLRTGIIQPFQLSGISYSRTVIADTFHTP